jgi:hypothetical protein
MGIRHLSQAERATKWVKRKMMNLWLMNWDCPGVNRTIPRPNPWIRLTNIAYPQADLTCG